MDLKQINDLSNRIIGLALEVHKSMGPGLLESVYQQCLAYELSKNNIDFVFEQPIPVKYKTIAIECGFRANLIVEKSIIVELKSVDKLLPIHKAQLLTYLKITGIKLGLIINFNTELLKNGIRRVIL